VGAVFGALDVSALELCLCFVAAAGGAVVQRAVGFGYALLVVPVLLFVAPVTVPAAPLVVAMPMVLVLCVLERGGFDAGGFAPLTVGRLPGTVAGAYVVTLLSTRVLGGAVGALLLCAVAGSLARGRRRASPGLEVAAGFASGVAGTIGAVGGPYMGLAFADRPGAVLRGTLAAAFLVGTVLSLGAILLAGAVEADAVRLGLALVPATFVGLVAGRRLKRWIDGPRLRPVVLSFAAAAGLFALARALVG